jgi:ubiquinol-cytochrome c reductase cytochrome b subunit
MSGKKNNIIYTIHNFHTNFVKAKNRIGPHNEDVVSVIVGSLLGDGYCNKRVIEGCRICFRQSSIHKEYLFWLYRFFHEKGYCSNLEPRFYTRKIKGTNNTYTGYEFNTYTFRSFNWIYKIFYYKGKKVLHSSIENYITPLSLAIWIMDDGSWVKSGVRISTNAFTHDKVRMLTEILQRKFNLETTIQKLSKPKLDDKNVIYLEKYSIYIKSTSVPLLRKLTKEYLHSSMLYKLGL